MFGAKYTLYCNQTNMPVLGVATITPSKYERNENVIIIITSRREVK